MSYQDTRGFANTKDSSESKSDIGKLIREGAQDYQVKAHLREKLPNKDAVEKAYAEYEEKMNKIRRKAQKFAQLILTRYSHLGTKRLLEKAYKLKKKYGFNDDEYHAFLNIALSDKSIAGVNQYMSPNTPMSHTLGYTADALIGKLNYKPEEAKTLQDILAMHQENMALHGQVVAQALIYRDCSPEALSGKYDRTKFNAYNYIHPLIAAFFIPRIKYIDEHMIIASITNIVAQRNSNNPIRIQPEWELFYDMISDPNEIACVGSKDSTILDLKNRARLQIELWKCVRDLRVGRYYSIDSSAFIMALNDCRTGIFDSPDMAFIKDEGTMLRKLMGAFSIRPTIVSISPLGGTMTLNYPMQAYALTQITSIPIVNFRLPLNIKNLNIRVNLQEALEQPDMYVENKMIVAKMKSIIYSRDLIVFYVNRRYQNINFARVVAPYNFSMLPTTLSGFETLNEVVVNYPQILTVGDDSFIPRSVVMIEKSGFNRDPARDPMREIIVGTSAGIIVPEDITAGRYNKECFIYDPQSAAIQYQGATGTFVERTPITTVPYQSSLYGPDDIESFESRASKRGTIYIYVKQDMSRFRL